MGFNLGEKESQFQAHRCMKSPNGLLPTLDEKTSPTPAPAEPAFCPLAVLINAYDQGDKVC